MSQGWSDIAQHATIDPDGYIWSGRDLLTPPASATGFNDPDSDGVHPFMFEMIGNFDAGKEKLEGAQLATATGLCFAIMQLWRRGSDMVKFHREFTTLKTCPGSGIDKNEFVAEVEKHGIKVSAPSSVRVVVNGNPVTDFIEKDGRIYVQLKALEDALGGDLRWDVDTKTASLNI
ncbi:hypothetical protein [Cohnella kolymensis]|uniref:hypothetical protein n=1 Tax=Cohnella kolymensis TaxID=1590652 RepID=UPI000696D4DB|nr:hypothetical protein [Cohnella kolymensis]